MSGIDIGLKHQVAELRFRELLAAAEHQRAIDAALEARSPSRHSCIVEVRAVVASAFCVAPAPEPSAAYLLLPVLPSLLAQTLV